MEGADAFATERVARAIDEAEALVREIVGAAARIGDRRLEGRIERLCDQAREVFRTVEPIRATSAGRGPSSTSTCVGLRDATVKFADLYGAPPRPGGAGEIRGAARRSRGELHQPRARICSKTTAAIWTSRSRCCANGCNRTG